MRRRLLTGLALVAAVLAAGESGAKSSSNDAFRLDLVWEQTDTIIELQSIPWGFPDSGQEQWVHRSAATRDCFWDSDDHARYLAPTRSTLAAAATYTLSRCVVADDPAYPNYAFFYGLVLESPSANLRVSITVTTANMSYTHTLTPTAEANMFVYRGCLGGPVYEYSQDVVGFPGTNGGTGVPAVVTFTVTNPTKRAARISTSGALIAQGDYHFQSSSGGFRFNGGYVFYCRHDNPMRVARPLLPGSVDPALYFD
jgi:hypothetical protein